MHLYLCDEFPRARHLIHVRNPDEALLLLETGVVTEITFGAGWERRDSANVVAQFLSASVLECKIPMLAWSVIQDSPNSHRVIKAIMLALDAFCKARGAPAPMSLEAIQRAVACGLDPTLTFDNFLVNEGNATAYAFATLVSLTSSVERNLLAIMGTKGTGKTHLLHAIGNQILRFEPAINLRNVSANTLVANGEERIRLTEIRGKQIILLDDVHVLCDRPEDLIALMQLCRQSISAGNQIVMVIEAHPDHPLHLPSALHELLRSALVVGLTSATYSD